MIYYLPAKIPTPKGGFNGIVGIILAGVFLSLTKSNRSVGGHSHGMLGQSKRTVKRTT
jgi:hypothetical protein